LKSDKDHLLEKHIPLKNFGCFWLLLFGRILEFSIVRRFWISKQGIAKETTIGWRIFYKISTGSKLISEMRRSRKLTTRNHGYLNSSDTLSAKSEKKEIPDTKFFGANEFDYLIIGSGPGGLACARELVKSGLNVLVIEAGSGENIQGTDCSLEQIMDSHWENFGKNYLKSESDISILQGRGLGGSTAISGMIIHRIPERCLAEMIEHFSNLGVKFGSGSYRECESEWIDNLNVSEPELLYPFASKSDYLRNMTKMSRAVLGCRDSGKCQIGCPNNGKNSLDQALYSELKRLGCKFLFNHHAQIKITEQGEAFALVSSGATKSKFSIKSKCGVFLAGGAISSPKLVKSAGFHSIVNRHNIRLNFGPSAAFLYSKPKIEIEKYLMGIEVFGESEIKYASQSLPKELLLARLWPFSNNPKAEFANIENWSIWTASFASDGAGQINTNSRSSKVGSFSLSDTDLEKFDVARCALKRIGIELGAKRIVNLASIGSSHLFSTLSGYGPFVSFKKTRSQNLTNSHRLVCVDASIIPIAIGVNPILTILTVSTLITRQVLSEARLSQL